MKRAILAFLCAAIMATATAQAGTTGVVTGTVLDENAAPVASALVTATSTSDIVRTTTDSNGHFVFLSLSPNIYTLGFERRGYLPVAYAGITVFADNSLALDFKMPRRIIAIAKLIDHFDPYVRPRFGGDFFYFSPYPYSGFPNPLTVGLSLIPGITVGNGGPIPH